MSSNQWRDAARRERRDDGTDEARGPETVITGGV
jgi:hypothetical protein